ncbi:MAG: HD domain-containing protein [Chloroflexi bacterium]|nr:HD domain-containing protein [Chloroflexota bacterium]
MHWEPNALIPLLAVMLYGVLFLVVAFSRSSTQIQERRIFREYLLAMLLWSLCAFLMLIGIGGVVFEFRLMSVSALGSMVALFRFAQTVLGRRWRWAIWVYLYAGAAITITMFTNWVVVSASVQAGVLSYKFAPQFVLVVGPGFGLYIYSLIQLMRGYRTSENPHQRNRLRYLIGGVGMVIATSLVNFTPLGKYPIDIAGNGINALLIAYAILRHNLLDIRVVIRKSLLYSIPTVLIGTGYFLVISLALRLFDLYSGLGIFILSLIVAILTALVAQPLRDKAQSWIDRLFFREKYHSGLMLQRLSSQAASILDLDIITNLILEETTSILHIEKAAFLLKRVESEEFFLTTQKGMASNAMIQLSKNHPIVLWFSNHDQLLTRHDLSVAPQFKALWGREREELERIEAELFIPLKVKGKLVGIFAVGVKRSEEGFSQDDQLTLTTLANQVAVTIENARLYTAEQHRRQELGTLYEMARILVVSDDVETVLNSIAEHVIKNVHATFARILTMEKGGEFLCRTTYPIRNIGNDLGIGKIEPLSTKKYYQRAINLGKALVLDWDDPAFNENDRHDLFLDLAKSLCISPLLVGDEPVGLLVLGEARRTTREPFDPDKLKLVNAISDQAASGLQRAILHEQLEESLVQTVLALAKAMDARDAYTHDHSQRMAAITEALCRKLDIDEEQIQAIRSAAALHDIGKIGVPDEILRKPGPLTSQEWDSMKRHPKIGADILAPVIKFTHIAPIIIAHHEKFDGSGYPYGLKGDQIPMGARILAVVDAYIAIIDERVYRKARSHKEAISELVKYSGSQFDPTVVDEFLKLVSEGSKDLAA